jgi:HPt (histidine-containing phosphotransfer) domain-containing protein
LVTIFRTNTDLILSRFGAFLSEADFDGVKTAAHTIKGGARQMGAEVVASICEEVEVAASDSGASKLEERVACLRAAFSSLGVEMSAFSASVQTKALQFAVPSPK